MAPTKSQSTLVASKGVTKSIVSMSRRAISTRTQKVMVDDSQSVGPVGKRKADSSPVRNEKGVKRSALGNVTNAVLNAIEDSKKYTRSKNDAKKATTVAAVSNAKSNENQAIFAAPNAVQRANKVVTRSLARATETTKTTINEATVGLKKFNISTTVAKGKKKTETTTNNNTAKPTIAVDRSSLSDESDNENIKSDSKTNARRLSNEFDLLDSEESSHYMSALEDL